MWKQIIHLNRLYRGFRFLSIMNLYRDGPQSAFQRLSYLTWKTKLVPACKKNFRATRHQMSAAVKRFIPLMDRVLVQKIKKEAKTATGIFLPDQAKQMINQATVIAVGEGRLMKDGQRIACTVKTGDNVIVPEFGGMTLKFDDEEYQVFRDEDIVGVLKKD